MMLPYVGCRLFYSLEAVETACRLLGIAQSDSSKIRSKWETLKRRIIAFVHSEGKTGGDFSDLYADLNGMFQTMTETELDLSSSPSLVGVCRFILSVSGLLVITRDVFNLPEFVTPESSFSYRSAVDDMKLARRCFDDEYEETMSVVVGTLRMSLSGPRLGRLYGLLVWQAENVLTRFKADVVDVASLAVEAEMRRRQTELCLLMVKRRERLARSHCE